MRSKHFGDLACVYLQFDRPVAVTVVTAQQPSVASPGFLRRLWEQESESVQEDIQDPRPLLVGQRSSPSWAEV